MFGALNFRLRRRVPGCRNFSLPGSRQRKIWQKRFWRREIDVLVIIWRTATFFSRCIFFLPLSLMHPPSPSSPTPTPLVTSFASPQSAVYLSARSPPPPSLPQYGCFARQGDPGHFQMFLNLFLSIDPPLMSAFERCQFYWVDWFKRVDCIPFVAGVNRERKRRERASAKKKHATGFMRGKKLHVAALRRSNPIGSIQ